MNDKTKFIVCTECGWCYFLDEESDAKIAYRFNHVCRKFRHISEEEMQRIPIGCTIAGLNPDDILIDEPLVD